MRWNSRVRPDALRWTRCAAGIRESVIQDVDIPIENAAEFLDFLLREIGILPVWICPIRPGAERGALHAVSDAPGAADGELRLLGRGAHARTARRRATSTG